MIFSSNAMTDAEKAYEYLNNPVSYVSAGDGELYINDILVDECYDIQYSYREMKEPVYGYRSTHFDKIIPGTVLITGQFSINYIHDGYLYNIINADRLLGDNIVSAADLYVGAPGLSDGMEYKTVLQQYNEMRKYADTLRQNSADNQTKIDILKQTLLQLDENSNALTSNKNGQLQNIEEQQSTWKDDMWSSEEGATERVDTAENTYNISQNMLNEYILNKDAISRFETNNISSVLAPKDLVTKFANVLEEKDSMEANAKEYAIDGELSILEISRLKAKLDLVNEEYRRVAEELVAPGFINDDVNKYAKFQQSKSNVELETRLAEADLEKRKSEVKDRIDKLSKSVETLKDLDNQLAQFKAKIDTPTAGMFSLRNKEWKSIDMLKYEQAKYTSGLNKFGSSETMRPENIQKDNIKFQIRFNGLNHKTLASVHLTGHSHLIGVGGEVIREQYVFIAKKLV